MLLLSKPVDIPLVRAVCISTRPGADKGWRDPGFPQAGDHTAAWLNSHTSKTYRLLSSAEWEGWASNGAKAQRPWGDDPGGACVHGNTFDEAARDALNIQGAVHLCKDADVFTATVGSYQENNKNVFDMIGNVFEWTSDCEDCDKHEISGGCWCSGPVMSTLAYSFSFKKNFRGSSIGFRVVRAD